MVKPQVSQQLSAVAGMIADPLNPVAKAAQRHLVGVINAKSRSEQQEAIRKAVALQARDSRIPPLNPDHGKHIWIYNMIRTNRVIYSLTKEINPDKALSQITFVGKKSVPSHIRPDVWNPLAVVTFPTPGQGLEAFRMLREFRMRHEYEWRQHLEDKNDLPAKRERIKMLQNQKPNSVADLAATLALQYRLGKEEFDRRLAELQENEQSYEAVTQSLRKIEAKMSKAGNTSEQESESHSDLVVQMNKLKTPEFTQLSRYHTAAKNAREAALQEADSRGLSAGADDTSALVQHRQLELLPKYLGELRNYVPLPKRGALRQKMIRELVPSRQYIPTLNGVKIMWADGNDRHYAQEWPVAVEHEIMGIFNRTAPDPERLRYLAQWRQEVPDVLARFEGREEDLLWREPFQWSGNTEEAEKFLQYLDIRDQQARQQTAKLGRRAQTPQALAPEEQTIVYDAEAARNNVAAFELLATKLPPPTDSKADSEGKDRKSMDDRHKHLVRAAVFRVHAQKARMLTAEQLGEDISAMEEDLETLKADVLDSIARKEWASLRTPDQVRMLSSGQVPAMRHADETPNQWQKRKVWMARILPVGGMQPSDWQSGSLILSPSKRKLLARAMLATNQQSSNLTAEEEEMLKNVELDGESSGKNEDSVDEAEDQKDGKNTEEQRERENTKQEEQRQNEEKKSLGARVFSTPSSSSKDDQPRA